MAGFFCGLSGGRIVLLTTDIQRQPHFPEQKYNGSTSVTDEGERNADHGHDAHHHADIDEDFPEKVEEDTRAEHAAEPVLGLHDR